MNKILRKLLFIFFIALFFIGAPIVVLYTAGYRYNTEYGFVSKTGVLSITTSPRGAIISINNSEESGSTPKIVKRLSPGKYTISLNKTGFHSWDTITEIKSGLTTYIQNIILFKKSDPTFLLEQEIDTTVPNKDASITAYIISNENWQEIWLYKNSSQEHELLDRIQTGKENVSLSWSNSDSFLLFKSDEIHVYRKNGDEIKITSSKIDDVNEIYWHQNDDKILIGITDENIIHFDVEKNSALTIDSSKSESTQVDASILTFIDNGSKTELRQTINENQKLIAVLDRGNYQIIFRNGNYIIAQDEFNEIYLIDIHADEPLLLQAKAELFDWIEKSNELVYSNGYEINIYSSDTHSTEFIIRQSDEITDLKWYPDGNAIIFSTNDCLCAIDRYLYGNSRKKTTLIKGDFIKKFWLSSNGKEVFILGQIDEHSGFYQLRLR